MYSRRRGFTVVEVLLASMIGVFIAVVAVSTLKAVSDSAETVSESMTTAAEVRYASNMIERDLFNLYRDPETDNMRLIAMVGIDDDITASELVFWTVGRVNARYGQPEGDIYEVEYILRKDREQQGRTVLYRRLWPNPDKEIQPGGVLTEIAEGIGVFEVRFFDGEEWFFEWPEDMGKMPELIEVTVGSEMIDGKAPVIETFVVNSPRGITGGRGGDSGGGRDSGGNRDSSSGGNNNNENNSGR